MARLGIAAALLCLALGGAAAAAEGGAGGPVVLSAQDRQKLVDDISDAVIKKLGHAGRPEPAAAPRPAPAAAGGMAPAMRVTHAMMAAAGTGVPDLGRRLAALHRALSEEGAGRPAAWSPELLLLYAVVLCLLAQKLGVLALGGVRRRIAGEAPGLHRGIRLAMTDIAGFAALAIAGMVLSYLWFAGDSVAARTWSGLFAALLFWRLWLIPVEIMLRPGLAAARPVAIADGAARRIAASVAALQAGAVLALVSARDLWGIDGIACVTIAAVLFALALSCLRGTIGELILGHYRADPGQAGLIRGLLSRRWYEGMLLVLLALYASFVAAAVLAELAYYVALVRTLEILLLLWGFEALCAKSLAAMRQRAEARGEDLVVAIIGVRILRALARTGALTLLAYIWLVRTMLPIGFGIEGLGHAVIRAGATLFVAYVLWEVLRTVIERHLGANAPRRPGEDDEAGGQAASRLITIMPLLRIGLAAGLFTVTGLIVASELGVDTAPLIAGAGVLGLAISFGSQSLVRDIVSGIFFIADDAFRVGEYVDTGRLKGTVEGMTIRSLRLRHQNGQLHTIPFGQLGAVTNFSRDWATIKFNLRLARDTDIELLRRTVKKLGLELMEDPELAPQIIEPLKLQGLAEVADNALVVRLKFTALPANSSWVQRTYLRHLYERLPAVGIGFASNVVAVQAVGAPAPAAAAAGAAALTVVPPSPEAAAG